MSRPATILQAVLVRCGAQTHAIPTVMVEAFNVMQDRITRARLAGDPPDLLISPRVGKIGWFVSDYALTQFPQLSSWEGLKDPAVAKAFATAATGDKGRFLGMDPSFSQYDEAIIKNLKVMDATALTLCRDQKLPIKVFSIFKHGALKRVVLGEDEGTLVHV